MAAWVREGGVKLWQQTGDRNVKLPRESDLLDGFQRSFNPANVTIRLQPQMKK